MSEPAKSDARTNLIKLQVFSYDGGQVSNVLSEDEQRADTIFNSSGVIKPPYDPNTLAAIAEGSNALRQNTESYAVNIDGFGHRFDPVIDVTAADADEKIAEIIRMEKVELGESKPGDKAAGLIDFEPSEAEVEKRKKQIASEMLLEHMKLQQFFKYCCPDYSFLTARVRARIDKEFTGNAYWEVTRDKLGNISGINHVPSPSIRIMKRGQPVEVDEQINTTPITYKTVKRPRRFRRYIQVTEGQTVFFKELGDLRLMSAKSGKFYEGPDPKANLEAMKKEEDSKGVPATEILHFLIYWPRGGAYGIPRWIGNLLEVLGSHKASEVTFLYFDNKAVPSMVVAVEGGSLNSGAAQQLKEIFEHQIAGVKNFHKCLVLEAAASENANPTADGRVRIRVTPLTQVTEGMFQKYDDNNRHKVGESFRLPPLLRGDSADANRATQDAALALAEDQVFTPERTEFDFAINQKVIRPLGIKYYTFVSNGLQLTDPTARAEAIKDLADFITPEEGRDFMEPVFGKRLPKIDEPWTKRPMKLTLMDVQSGVADGDGGDQAPADPANPDAAAAPKDAKKKPATATDPKAKDGKKKDPQTVKKAVGMVGEALRLIRVQGALDAAEVTAAQESFRHETRKNAEGEDEEVLIIPAEIMSELVDTQD